MTNIRNNFIDSIGNTPLIKLKAASEITGCNIYGKAEFLNPGGSVISGSGSELLQNCPGNPPRKGFGGVCGGALASRKLLQNLSVVGSTARIPQQIQNRRGHLSSVGVGVGVRDLDKVRPGSCRKQRCAPFGTTPGP